MKAGVRAFCLFYFIYVALYALRAKASMYIYIARISYGDSVLVSCVLSACHVPVPFQDQVR